MKEIIFFKKAITPTIPDPCGKLVCGDAEYLVAYKRENKFVAIGVVSPGRYWEVGRLCEEADDREVQEWAKERFGAVDIMHCPYAPGTYHRRIWRPGLENDSQHQDLPLLAPTIDVYTQSILSTRILISKMLELFVTIEPAKGNLESYGHSIRNLLLLACMEVESSWCSVLREHNYEPTKDRFDTTDYVKVRDKMHLQDFTVRLRSYPEFPSFSPFKRWDIMCPTKSLVWYGAYNKTKHSREGNLKLATLKNAVHAVGASVVMFHAQFGFPGSLDLRCGTMPISEVFSIDRPEYPRHECYVPLFDENSPDPEDWVAVPCRF